MLHAFTSCNTLFEDTNVSTAISSPFASVDALMPQERNFVKAAVEKRQREFATARVLARRLLADYGIRQYPLLNDDDRVPVWPEGFVGSISHCDDCCVVALLGKSGNTISIGIDVEPDTAIDPDLWLAHYAAGRLHSISTKDSLAKAESHLERAMSLQPDNDDARVYYAALKIFQGKADEAVAIIEPIIATHPNPPFWYYLTLGNGLFHLGKHDAAEDAFDKCLTQMPSSPYCLRFQIANFGAMGREDDAMWLLEEYGILGFDTSLSGILELLLYQAPTYRDRMEKALRAAGVGD